MALQRSTADPFDVRLGSQDAEDAYRAAARRAVEARWAERLFDRDASLWSDDPAVQARVADRLGWLDVPATFRDRIPALEGFGEGIRASGFRTAVVCGMGANGLVPAVFGSVFGGIPDWLTVRVLDSTDPAAVEASLADLDRLTTLVVVSSRSGTTLQTLAFEADAWERVETTLKAHHAPRWESAGDLMVAVTGPDSALRAIPHHDRLREVFLNPADVEGAYAALTYVGLVPASLLGVDLDPLLDSAALMLERCRAADPAENPGLALGLALGSLARIGRDKVTLVPDPEIEAFGAWLEQLLAGSTGKGGLGIVPVDREPLGEARAYGPDRVFVRIGLAPTETSSRDEQTVDGSAVLPGASPAAEALLDELSAAGHPVLRLRLQDPIDLGGELVRWQVATAFAAAVLGVDPFDHPDVERSREVARRALEHREDRHEAAADNGATNRTIPDRERPAAPEALATEGPLTLYGDTALRLSAGPGSFVGELARHLARLRPSGYAALLAYLAPTPERDDRIASIRALLRDRTLRATTAGYGPRYLHSTGQLHKGGARSGWFLQLTVGHPVDRPIPGRHYSFGDLTDADAAADLAALESRDLPVLRVDLGADTDAGLEALERALVAALDLGST